MFLDVQKMTFIGGIIDLIDQIRYFVGRYNKKTKKNTTKFVGKPAFREADKQMGRDLAAH